MRQTKIVATIGPASEGSRVLPQLLRAGVDVVRLNFSHGTYQEMTRIVRDVHHQRARLGLPTAIMQDLQGPRIRLGKLPAAGVPVKRGDVVALVYERDLPVTVPEGVIALPVRARLSRIVKRREPIMIQDGLARLRVREVTGTMVIASVEQGYILTSNRGINLPKSTLPDIIITDKDRRDIRFGVRQKVDWIALSFVRDAADVRALRWLLPQRGNYRPKIIAKIERREAVRNFDRILAEADGIMVARGDLGIELPAARVPMLQKQFIDKARAAGKPVVVATQMLESMTVNPQPTRAEVSDVANAILDGTDAVMLSAETATGQFPVKAVKVMAQIIRNAEAASSRQTGDFPVRTAADTPALLTETINTVVQSNHLGAIVVMSSSGRSAQLIAATRPVVPIIALTQNHTTKHQMALLWGVEPHYVRRYDTLDKLIRASVNLLVTRKIVRRRDRIIIACGHPTGPHGELNLLKIQTIS